MHHQKLPVKHLVFEPQHGYITQPRVEPMGKAGSEDSPNPESGCTNSQQNRPTLGWSLPAIHRRPWFVIHTQRRNRHSLALIIKYHDQLLLLDDPNKRRDRSIIPRQSDLTILCDLLERRSPKHLL